MKIWVAVVSHRHGQNVYAAKTEERLVRELYSYVEQWWESEIPNEAFPANLSGKETVDLYFERVGHEFLEALEETTLLGKEKSGD